MNKKILVLCTTLLATPISAGQSNTQGYDPAELTQLYNIGCLTLLCAAAYVVREFGLLEPKVNPFGCPLEKSHQTNNSAKSKQKQPLLPVTIQKKKN